MEKLIIFMIFVGFSIVSSIAKSAKEKREKEKALQRRRVRAGGEQAQVAPKKSVQSEIESFLSEVGEGRATPRDDDEARRRKELEDAKRRKQQAIRQRQKEAAARKRQQQAQKQRAESGISQRPARRPIHETVAQSVESHLGKRSTEMPRSTGTVVRKGASAEIFAMLQDREGVRNAIVVNEILNRPRALRND